MIDLASLIDEVRETGTVIEEGGGGGHIDHLYQDGKLTFGEMKQIFNDVFQGKVVLLEKIDGQNLMVTYKDGGFRFARNKSTLRDPMDISRLERYFDGNPKVREAYVTSANNLVKALNTIQGQDLARVFRNGQNYANIEIVYPPVKNVLDYGNRCFLQINGVDCFDGKFNRIKSDEEASKWLYETLKSHDALKQEMFEITEPNILRMKNSVNAKKALDILMEDFNRLIDGYSLKTSIQDYANDRLKRYIYNVCNKNNLEVEPDCQFVRELADRLNNASRRRPTKADIGCFAKRDGINVHGDDYLKTIQYLDETRDEMNEEIMRPIETIVMKAGNLLLKNLSGFMAADPQKTSQKLVQKLEETISAIEADSSHITSDKLKAFRRNMRKIEEWKDRYMPSEGCVIKLPGGKCYKVVGSFGACNQIMHLLDK